MNQNPSRDLRIWKPLGNRQIRLIELELWQSMPELEMPQSEFTVRSKAMIFDTPNHFTPPKVSRNRPQQGKKRSQHCSSSNMRRVHTTYVKKFPVLGSPRTHLVAELFTYDLDDPKRRKFEALSWSWGPMAEVPLGR